MKNGDIFLSNVFVQLTETRFKGPKRTNYDYDGKSDHKHVKLCAILLLHVQIQF